MHVLTKIFIVLVSLLAVLLVPLMVVYATNENSFKAKFQEAEARAAIAQELVKQTEARSGADAAKLNTNIDELKAMNSTLRSDKTAADTSVRQLESQLATSRTSQDAITGDIKLIKTTVDAGQQLIESLINETRELRASAVANEKVKVELDEANRDLTGQLEVAEQARRALAEELARLKDEHTRAVTTLSQYIAQHGDIRVGALGKGLLIPDKTLTATVIRVERSSGEILAEIDAGSKDGIKENWSMSIVNGGAFIGNLQIINVDINRATGKVTLESKERGTVQVGHKAHAYAGQE